MELVFNCPLAHLEVVLRREKPLATRIIDNLQSSNLIIYPPKEYEFACITGASVEEIWPLVFGSQTTTKYANLPLYVCQKQLTSNEFLIKYVTLDKVHLDSASLRVVR